ncbi:Hypothetical predicted protein [Podarcis lilfordi]|uniref:Uncharacterized protein n=1 Tax=Podarcis lilfordi TaxID=74358 RepID=A0AA35KGR1_9SAUR|nr:Hypothetical predicted protein [Podarcis lilfordi]
MGNDASLSSRLPLLWQGHCGEPAPLSLSGSEFLLKALLQTSEVRKPREESLPWQGDPPTHPPTQAYEGQAATRGFSQALFLDEDAWRWTKQLARAFEFLEKASGDGEKEREKAARVCALVCHVTAAWHPPSLPPSLPPSQTPHKELAGVCRRGTEVGIPGDRHFVQDAAARRPHCGLKILSIADAEGAGRERPAGCWRGGGTLRRPDGALAGLKGGQGNGGGGGAGGGCWVRTGGGSSPQGKGGSRGDGRSADRLVGLLYRHTKQEAVWSSENSRIRI